MSTNTPWTFSSLGCPDLGLDEVCALARQWEMSVLELRCLGGRMDLPALFAETYGTPERLGQAISAQGMRVQVLGTSLRLIGATAVSCVEFLEFVPWAEALGVPFLRVFDGGEHGQTLTAGQATEAVAMVQWWQDLRRRSGWRVDIVMETHDACITRSACLEIEDHLAEPVAILWDTHHTWRAGEPVAETWTALAPYVRHVHVKDSADDHSIPAGYRYTLPGAGGFPWAELQAAWQRQPYEGVVSLEWEKKWHPDLPPLKEALAAARTAGWF